MKTITLSDLKKNGSNAIPDGETSFLIVNSKPKSAVVPIELYEDYVDALEELEDLKTLIERANEEDIPAEKVFKKIYDNK